MAKLTSARLKVKQCCDEMRPFYYEVSKDDTIKLEYRDDAFYHNVRFCMWCGKRLETYAEDPSEMMKAFDELKKKMELDESLRYAKLSPAEKAKHDLRIQMKEDQDRKNDLIKDGERRKKVRNERRKKR